MAATHKFRIEDQGGVAQQVLTQMLVHAQDGHFIRISDAQLGSVVLASTELIARSFEDNLTADVRREQIEDVMRLNPAPALKIWLQQGEAIIGGDILSELRERLGGARLT